MRTQTGTITAILGDLTLPRASSALSQPPRMPTGLAVTQVLKQAHVKNSSS